MLLFMPGCIGAQLKFYPVIAKSGPGPGGWQEACLEARMENMTTHDSHICALGIGMPIETRDNGYIPAWEAAEIATECINLASERIVLPAPPDNPSALVCLQFKDTFHLLLTERVLGARVNLGCRKDISPTRVGF
ncbi:hypothetical protein [Hyalangium versicolor]|uniref:hypothetical protein n=1 Tax=Hyalangium versicolor TaxID=2861190 RepID=UPI001CCD3049|nr:hypothetical protein [Hyalangium versicolor]